MPDFDGAAAVAEPIDSVGANETVDTSIGEGSGVQDTTDTGDDLGTSAEISELTPNVSQKGKVDLASVVKNSSEALKAINPALPAAIRTAAFELGGLYREFPGGLKEAVAAKTTLSEYGGVEGLKESQEALADYGALESMFEKADPQFMVSLADTLPESFSQVMPEGLAKWKSIDAEGYNHNLAKVMVQTLDGVGVSQSLENIWAGLPDGDAKNAVAKLWQNIDGFRKLGEKAPERKVDPKNEAFTKREQDLAQREVQMMLKPIASEGRQQIQSITDREMMASYRWAETDPSVKEAVMDRVRSEVVGASKKDKGFLKEFDRLKDRSDSAGLSRHVKNFQDRVTPQIVARVAKLFAVKPKGASATIKTPVAGTQSAATPIAQGWTRVSAQPSASLVNRSATTDDMILSNRAILKDGKRVQWA